MAKGLILKSGLVQENGSSDTLDVNRLVLTGGGTGGATVDWPFVSAPTTPSDGEMWADASGLYYRKAGATINLTTASGGSPAGSDHDIQYNNATAFGAITSNATATKQFLSQSGNGTTANIAAWSALATSDIPAHYLGTTAITFSRASGAQTLNGVSIDGSAATITVATDSTATTFYPVFSAIAAGTALKGNTSLSFVPSTGTLTTTILVSNTHASAASSALTLNSKLAAGSASTDFVLNSNAATRTAGKLFDLQNNASTRFSIDYAGAITTASTLIMTASTTARASARFGLGSAPTTPTNGDMWATSAGLYYRNNGATVNLTAGSSALDYQGVVAEASLDTAVTPGYYQIAHSTHTNLLFVLTDNGSVGPLQLAFDYDQVGNPTGMFQFRNKTDSTTWSPWKGVAYVNMATGGFDGLYSTPLTAGYSGLYVDLPSSGIGTGVTIYTLDGSAYLQDWTRADTSSSFRMWINDSNRMLFQPALGSVGQDFEFTTTVYVGNVVAGDNVTGAYVASTWSHDGDTLLRVDNQYSGASATATALLGTYGATWAIRTGSTANNSNGLEFVDDWDSAKTVRLSLARSGKLTLKGTSAGGGVVFEVRVDNTPVASIDYLGRGWMNELLLDAGLYIERGGALPAISITRTDYPSTITLSSDATSLVVSGGIKAPGFSTTGTAPGSGEVQATTVNCTALNANLGAGAGIVVATAADTTFGVSNVPSRLRTTSDQSISNTTVANINGLYFYAQANCVYEFEFVVVMSALATAVSAFSWTGPGTPSYFAYHCTGQSTTAGALQSFSVFGSAYTGQTMSAGAAGIWRIRGILNNGATAGNVQLRWTNSGAGTTTIKAGSFVKVCRMG